MKIKTLIDDVRAGNKWAFEKLASFDFFPLLLKRTVAKLSAESKSFDLQELKRRSLSTLYEIIIQEFKPSKCADYKSLKTYFNKVFPKRLKEEMMYEGLGISETELSQLRKLKRAEESLLNQLQRAPTHEELMKELKIGKEEYMSLRRLEKMIYSLKEGNEAVEKLLEGMEEQQNNV